MGIGQHLKQARGAARLSLADVAAVGHFTRGHLNNIEAGRRVASPGVVAAYEKALAMHRRHLFQFAAAAIGSLVVTGDEAGAARDLYTTIACGDGGPLATVQTSHAVDHAIQRLAVRETKSITRLLTWLNDGSDPILRVNAAGILAKTGSPDLADDVALALGRDAQMRQLYSMAVRHRVGQDDQMLAAELTNSGDSGARWCAAWLLPDNFRPAVVDAMRVEPSKENLRAMALATTGALRDVRD